MRGKRSQCVGHIHDGLIAALVYGHFAKTSVLRRDRFFGLET
ncbi:protein of unknown function [Candidatus Filomicrobium marinum]|uniref:Uncharacterized protein n=1 Tax=Candidatus Filomicrobium marinum TaxID=1608628 RepID=A0A0D6JHU0_9HYPH|nr:protein of unknown function [Candidatus Filomicrobium marinum]